MAIVFTVIFFIEASLESLFVQHHAMLMREHPINMFIIILVAIFRTFIEDLYKGAFFRFRFGSNEAQSTFGHEILARYRFIFSISIRQ